MFFVGNNKDIEKIFGVTLISSSIMNNALRKWEQISAGNPPWQNASDDIETVNMAKHISDTRAKLVTLDIGIAVSGSLRADYLQTIADDLLRRLPEHIADAERMGGIIIKWNGETWDFILPGNFGITAVNSNGVIQGAIFAVHSMQGKNTIRVSSTIVLTTMYTKLLIEFSKINSA